MANAEQFRWFAALCYDTRDDVKAGNVRAYRVCLSLTDGYKDIEADQLKALLRKQPNAVRGLALSKDGKDIICTYGDFADFTPIVMGLDAGKDGTDGVIVTGVCIDDAGEITAYQLFGVSALIWVTTASFAEFLESKSTSNFSGTFGSIKLNDGSDIPVYKLTPAIQKKIDWFLVVTKSAVDEGALIREETAVLKKELGVDSLVASERAVVEERVAVKVNDIMARGLPIVRLSRGSLSAFDVADADGLTAKTKLLRSERILRDYAPFMWSLLHTLKHIDSPDYDAVAGVSVNSFTYNPTMMQYYVLAEFQHTLEHEMWHLVLMHPAREGNKIHVLWNLACDLEVNAHIREAHGLRFVGDQQQLTRVTKDGKEEKLSAFIKSKTGHYDSPLFDIKTDTAEKVYWELFAENQKALQDAMKQAGQQGGGGGQGSGGQGNDGGQDQGGQGGGGQNSTQGGQGGSGQGGDKDDKSSQTQGGGGGGGQGDKQDDQTQGSGGGQGDKQDDQTQGGNGKGQTGNEQLGHTGNEKDDQSSDVGSSGDGSSGNQQSGGGIGNGSPQGNSSDGNSGNGSGSQQGNGQQGNGQQPNSGDSSDGSQPSGQNSGDGSDGDGLSGQVVDGGIDVYFRGQKIGRIDPNDKSQTDLFKTPDTPTDESAEQEIKRILGTAATNHRRNFGSFGGPSGSVAERMVEMNLESRINWKRAITAKFLELSRKITSLARPNRRHISAGVHYPGEQSADPNKLRAVLAVDTSGSIGDADLAVVLAEISQLTKQYDCELELWFWDTAVQEKLAFSTVPEMLKKRPKFSGGGGTNANCVFEELSKPQYKKAGKAPKLVIFFTDGVFGAISRKHYGFAPKTIWMLHEYSYSNFTAPFGIKAEFKKEKE